MPPTLEVFGLRKYPNETSRPWMPYPLESISRSSNSSRYRLYFLTRLKRSEHVLGRESCGMRTCALVLTFITTQPVPLPCRPNERQTSIQSLRCETQIGPSGCSFEFRNALMLTITTTELLSDPEVPSEHQADGHQGHVS